MSGLGIGLKYTLDDLKARENLAQIVDRLEHPQRALYDCGVQQLRSMEKNFQAQGRPIAWVDNAPSTKRHKKKTGHTKILIDRGILKNAGTAEVQDDTLIVSDAVPYARVQQQGAEIHQSARWQTARDTGKAGGKIQFISRAKAESYKRKKFHLLRLNERIIKIPARKFMLFLPQDIQIHEKILTRYALRGTTE